MEKIPRESSSRDVAAPVGAISDWIDPAAGLAGCESMVDRAAGLVEVRPLKLADAVMQSQQRADDAVLCEDGVWRPQTSPEEQAKGHFRGIGGIVYEDWNDPGHYDF